MFLDPRLRHLHRRLIQALAPRSEPVSKFHNRYTPGPEDQEDRDDGQSTNAGIEREAQTKVSLHEESRSVETDAYRV